MAVLRALDIIGGKSTWRTPMSNHRNSLIRVLTLTVGQAMGLGRSGRLALTLKEQRAWMEIVARALGLRPRE